MTEARLRRIGRADSTLRRAAALEVVGAVLAPTPRFFLR